MIKNGLEVYDLVIEPKDGLSAYLSWETVVMTDLMKKNVPHCRKYYRITGIKMTRSSVLEIRFTFTNGRNFTPNK